MKLFLLGMLTAIIIIDATRIIIKCIKNEEHVFEASKWMDDLGDYTPGVDEIVYSSDLRYRDSSITVDTKDTCDPKQDRDIDQEDENNGPAADGIYFQ